MQFDERDEKALIALAKELEIEICGSLADLAEDISKLFNKLTEQLDEAQSELDSAEDDASEANERADELSVSFAEVSCRLREIVKELSPNAFPKPTEREIADLIASARETLAQNGITP